jgi:phosphatidate cytidylyltransferase
MKRVLTAVAGVPVVVGVTLWGPDWLYTFLVAAVAAVAFDEYLAVTGGRDRGGRWIVVPGLAVTASFSLGLQWALIALAMTLLIVMGASLLGPVHDARDRIVLGASGLLYAAALPGFLLLVPRAEVLLLVGVVWAGDVGAYYGGRALGRHALAPAISPKKTVEGALIGLAASVAAGFAIVWVLQVDGGSALLGVFIVIVAISAQVGDLAESALKRSAGVKDSSSLLPGHGGMLDRIDGLLFAAPVFYFLWSI